MSSTSFKGIPANLDGHFPQTGKQAPDFMLVATDLSSKTLADFSGKRNILNIFPGIDTGICATSVRQFNQKGATLANTTILCISADLPFAQARFCGTEGIKNVVMLSCFRDPSFKHSYGVDIKNGLLSGLCARAVIVLDTENKVIYSELVNEITEEPNYDAAIHALTN